VRAGGGGDFRESCTFELMATNATPRWLYA
jgi:hypothetical protein